MEAINALIALCPSGAVPIVICIVLCWALYLKIGKDRKNTKAERDGDRDDLDKRLSLVENEIAELKALDLSSKLASIQTDIQWIKTKLMENIK